MHEKSDNPFKFWRELKRRKVVRVIIGYLASAYVILELTSIVAEPWGLPDWTINLVSVLLAIGLVVTAIVSWIFDITPGGIEKTKPAKLAREQEKITKSPKRKLRVSDIIISILLVAVIVLVYPKIFKKDKLEQLRSGKEITVAVMPFQNMTGDTTRNIWQDVIKDELITHLTNSKELKVRQTESTNTLIQSKGLINYASITPSIANELSRDLDADVFINGSIKTVGHKIRVNAQIFDSKTNESLKAFTIEGETKEDYIIHIIDSLSAQINYYLIKSVMDKELNQGYRPYSTTSSPEAYRKYIQSRNALRTGDWQTAIKYGLETIRIDSNFIAATVELIWICNNHQIYEMAKKLCLKLYSERSEMSIYDEARINWIYAWLFETPRESIMALKQLLEIDDQNPGTYSRLGQSYLRLHEYDKAITEYEKALDIYKRWDSKPGSFYYVYLGRAFHKTGQIRKERKLYRKAEKDFPVGDPIIKEELLRSHAVLELSEGKTKAANEYIEKYISSLEERYESEADIATGLAMTYWSAEIFDKAEEYYREALKLAPGSHRMMNQLAWFLIDTERDIAEGMELIEKALELSPDHYSYFDTKGAGLYKQGKYQEALQLFQKNWVLRMENAVYNHDEFLRLEAAKKAVANQKNEI